MWPLLTENKYLTLDAALVYIYHSGHIPHHMKTSVYLFFQRKSWIIYTLVKVGLQPDKLATSDGNSCNMLLNGRHLSNTVLDRMVYTLKGPLKTTGTAQESLRKPWWNIFETWFLCLPYQNQVLMYMQDRWMLNNFQTCLHSTFILIPKQKKKEEKHNGEDKNIQ